MRKTALVVMALLAATTMAAHADTYTYSYAGPTFLGGTDHVAVTFTTSAPLAPSRSYLSAADANVVSGAVTVVGPNGVVTGFTLPVGTFQLHTSSAAGVAIPGIDAWFRPGRRQQSQRNVAGHDRRALPGVHDEHAGLHPRFGCARRHRTRDGRVQLRPGHRNHVLCVVLRHHRLHARGQRSTVRGQLQRHHQSIAHGCGQLDDGAQCRWDDHPAAPGSGPTRDVRQPPRRHGRNRLQQRRTLRLGWRTAVHVDRVRTACRPRDGPRDGRGERHADDGRDLQLQCLGGRQRRRSGLDGAVGADQRGSRSVLGQGCADQRRQQVLARCLRRPRQRRAERRVYADGGGYDVHRRHDHVRCR